LPARQTFQIGAGQLPLAGRHAQLILQRFQTPLAGFQCLLVGFQLLEILCQLPLLLRQLLLDRLQFTRGGPRLGSLCGRRGNDQGSRNQPCLSQRDRQRSGRAPWHPTCIHDTQGIDSHNLPLTERFLAGVEILYIRFFSSC
jgi:hypothetical protein